MRPLPCLSWIWKRRGRNKKTCKHLPVIPKDPKDRGLTLSGQGKKDKTRQDKTRQGKARQGKARIGKGRKDKASKVRQDKTGERKRRLDKGRHD